MQAATGFVVTCNISMPLHKYSFIINEINVLLLPYPSKIQSNLVNKKHLTAGMCHMQICTTADDVLLSCMQEKESYSFRQHVSVN